MKKIYYLNDNKIGHLRQSEGLAQALQQLINDDVAIESVTIFSIWQYFRSFGQSAKAIEMNSIVIGSGHRTHFGLLYYRLKYQAKTIVIMNPSLPKSWFDYCIIPMHDGIAEKDNVIVTEGAMNALSLRNIEKTNQLLILIGGKSDSCDWNNDFIYQQLQEKLQTLDAKIKIVLSTSRRTPNNFIKNLPQEIQMKVQVIDFSSVSSDWLPEELLKSSLAWITAESISMMYEALSANCVVETLSVSGLKGKIAKNLEHLVDLGLVDSEKIHPERLNEAFRVATKLLQLGLVDDRIDKR